MTVELRAASLSRLLLVGLLVSLGLGGCRAETPIPDPTRGVILISLDTLAAGHLSTYGYPRETSPFLDSLATRGTLFENAIVQYPSTLVSHVSMFTGLYPQEHGVLPFTSKRLSPAIDTLPERFERHGFRTAGHTEGGYVSHDFGFERGFEEFSDPNTTADTDIVDTLRRGIDFLSKLDSEERFFLFLHSYSIHDPYTPPEPFRSWFWKRAPVATFAAEGRNLSQVNGGSRDVTPQAVEYFKALYDGSIRHVDSVLEHFFGELETMGLLAETTIVITSDHGEEFLQHGKLVHEQIYPECLRVPLIVLHPHIGHGRRVRGLVQSIDIAPTLYELAAVPPPRQLSGRSLVANLYQPDQVLSRTAYAETLGTDRQRTLISAVGRGLYQLIETETVAESDGVWIARSAAFDTTESTLELSAASFHRPRTLRVEAGTARMSFDIGTEWAPFELELPDTGAARRVLLTASGCDSPRSVGLVDDPRCLGIKLRGVSLSRTELFDWRRDRAARDDVAFARPGLRDRLARALARTRHQRLAEPDPMTVSKETEEALRALGYIE